MIYRPRTDQLDVVLQVAQPGDVIQLGPERYTTLGNWTAPKARGYCNVAPGVAIRGEGMDRTTIALHSDAIRIADGQIRPDRDLTALWVGAGVEITGLEIDANEGAFPSDPRSGWHVSGIRRHGRIRLEQVRIVGLRGCWKAEGTLHPEIESFALSGGGELRGSVVRDVWVDGVADAAYVSGTVLGGGDSDALQAMVENVHVNLGRDNQLGFSASHGTLIRGCSSRGGRFGFYNDTGPTWGVHLDLCDLDGSHAAIGLRSQMPGDRRRVRVTNSTLRGPRMLEVLHLPGGEVECSVDMQGNVSPNASYVACVDNPDPCRVRIQDCVFPSGAVRFRTRRSPEIITRANFDLERRPLPNALKELVA